MQTLLVLPPTLLQFPPQPEPPGGPINAGCLHLVAAIVLLVALVAFALFHRNRRQ